MTGVAVLEPQRAAGEPGPSQREPWVKRVWAGLDWTGRILVPLGLAAVLTVLAVGAVGSQGGDDEETSLAYTGEVESATPHETCVAQVMAMAVNINDNRAYTEEITVNGVSDPFLAAARDVVSVFTRNQYSVGNSAAYEEAEYAADRWCTDSLGDAIRPNYPTDGTHP